MIKVFEWVEIDAHQIERKNRLDLNEVAYCNAIYSTVTLKSGAAIQVSQDTFERLLDCLSKWEKQCDANNNNAKELPAHIRVKMDQFKDRGKGDPIYGKGLNKHFYFNHRHISEKEFSELIKFMRWAGIKISQVPKLEEFDLGGEVYVNHHAFACFGVDSAGETYFRNEISPLMRQRSGCYVFPDKTPVESIVEHINIAWKGQDL